MMTRPSRVLLLVASAALCACGGDEAGTTSDTAAPTDTDPPDSGGGDTGGATETITFDTGLDSGGPGSDTGAPGDVVQGGFGTPCQGNIDCLQGFCVEGPEGFVCTEQCETECPGGYDCRGVQSGSADLVFLCMPRVARVCVPCKADYQCPSGACLELGDVGGQCSYTCDDDGACPTGFVCGADPAGTHPGKFCLPRSGSCDCTPDLAGAVRTCTSANGFGTCYGVETCDAAAGWTGCTAATAVAEICDGRDNDCDALVDDGVETNTPCETTNAFGTCSGLKVCVGTQGHVCTAATPEAESCDFRDNDCDGEIDEDFKDAAGEFSLGEHCGSCNNDCAEKIANGTGRCEIVEGASPVCVVAACDPDYVELNRFQCALPPDVSCLPCQSEDECYDGSCVPLDGQQVCVVPCGDSGSCQDGYACEDVAGEERCVPVSGSCLCNPQTDGQIRTCVRSSSSGTCYGQETCDAANGWVGCTARDPGDEVCNGVDDDCSSGVDDVIGRGNACTNDNALGSCPGVLDCVDGDEALACVGPTPAAEVCNYDDDDCDGQTDEGFANLYVSCSAGVGICQRFGFYECSADGSATACNVTAGTASSETCDRLDNDCDGQTDETYADLGDVCFTGVGACQGAGTRVCNAGGNATECNAVAGAAGTESCDLVDNDCDGQTDEDYKNVSGKYDDDTTCGNCFTNCAVILDRPNAAGVCNATPQIPVCELDCDSGYFNLNDVPDDGCEFELDDDAIYVGIDSAGANDDNGCGLGPDGTGSGNHPCESITFGLSRAQSTNRSKLIVADGLYTEQVTLANGISIYGGYRFDTWDRHLSSTGTTVRGPEGTGHRKAVVAIDITEDTVVEGLVINAANAISTGANSYGIYVRNSNGNLEIRNNLIFAGLGGPGAKGAAGQSGENGVNGTAGSPTKNVASCSNNLSEGGIGGFKECRTPGSQPSDPMEDVSGGKGGNSVCPAQGVHEGSGLAGENSGGAGGSGGWGHNSTTSSCSPSTEGPEVGAPGNDGPVLLSRDGNGGNGCSDDDGSVVASEWRGVPGSNGVHGQHGGGGGGGGAGSGGIVSGGNGYDISGSGGGGGSGGCAGWLGAAGSGGGGSFGIFVYWSTPASAGGVPSIHDNVISRNQGGPGGDGGNGGAGGDPGTGALGGALAGRKSPIFCVFGGAKGGYGARGGHGGGGGGGCGGASFDIYAAGINSQANDFGDNSFPNSTTDTGGVSGPGGNSSNTNKKGTAGAEGAFGTVRVID